LSWTIRLGYASPLRIRSLFSEYEFVNDDYDVYSYKWYYLALVLEHKRKLVTRTPHDSSHSTYQVDKPALHANILRRVPVSSALIIILLKPNAIWWSNG
jgi:hypothetical protein